VLFLSRYDNKVDKKGRVSVPAPFRALLAGQPFAGIVIYPSPIAGAIDGCGMDRMEKLSQGIDTFNPFSEEYGAFANSILAQSHALQFDSEGRVVLPEALIAYAAIEDVATFAGLGQTFQIWRPEHYDAHLETARQKAKEQAAHFELTRRQDDGGAP
jgi:MraZ protein